MVSAGLSVDQRAALLGLARARIAARLRGGAPSDVAAAPALRAYGAFVTLRTQAGELRGCIGQMGSERPLASMVAEAAVASATEDPRFPPLTAAELGQVSIEISVLTPLEITPPEGVEVGRHGVSIRAAGRSGLLLPQVAPEHGWDRETLLAMVCRKAGLPADAWREPGCELRRFEAEVFGEQS